MKQERGKKRKGNKKRKKERKRREKQEKIAKIRLKGVKKKSVLDEKPREYTRHGGKTDFFPHETTVYFFSY